MILLETGASPIHPGAPPRVNPFSTPSLALNTDHFAFLDCRAP
jgi:hypothetical protein